MTAVSAGLLLWRATAGGPEFLLGHPGGPFWTHRDRAAWSIPKGLVEPGEPPWDAALREFAEETGLSLSPDAAAVAAVAAVGLSPCRTSGGKTIHAWLVEADFDVAMLQSNRFEMEWPPKSGRSMSFPELDRAAWFDAATAAQKIHKGQLPILAEALGRLAADRGPTG